MALITPYSQRARTPDAIGASVKDGTVMDHRTASAPTEYARILRILGDSEDADVRAFSKVPGKKIPTESVEVFENEVHVRVKGITEAIVISKSADFSSQLGGGMFNSFIDASLILKHLGRINQQPEISIPTTTLVFPAIKAVRDDVLAKVEKAGVNNLKAFPVEGTTRQSLFVRKKDEPEKVISFCTQTGEIEDTNQLPNINPQTGFIVINNEPPDGQTFDEIARHYEKATKIWAVGSQQITQGFSSNISFLSHCDTITLNLDELVLWIRSHTDPAIYNDSILLEQLEDVDAQENEAYQAEMASLQADADNIRAAHPKYAQVSSLNTQLDKVQKKLSKNPEKRAKAAQRCADLIHKEGFRTGTLFITDGGNPTIISHRLSSTQKTQSALAVLPAKRTREIKDIIQKYDLSADDDQTGAGDAVSGAILALKQFTNNEVDPLTIGILANYISALIYRTPYSNLLELENNHPGLLAEVMDLAMSKIERSHRALKGNAERPLLNPEGQKESPIGKMLE